MADAERIMVLLVDDRPENLLAYRAILSELDLELVLAESGTDALKQVLQHDFAVILLDVNMPQMDGFEAAKLIAGRKRSAHTPIIFLTAFPDEVSATQGYEHGAVDYLQTPVVPQILRAKVKVFVELFRMTEQVKRQGEERLALAEERMRRAAAEETNQRLRYLADATAKLGQSLDDSTTACDAAHLAVPTLGDQAFVAQHDPTRRVWLIARTEGAAAETAAPASAARELPDLDSLPRDLAVAVEEAMATRAMVLVPDTKAEPQAEPRAVVFPLGSTKSTFGAFGISREASGRPFTSADLTVAGALASRAAIALENARLYKDLERADRQKNEFLSMLAHELRNPLAPIRTALDVLRLRSDADAELVWARDIVDRQTVHLVRLVDDLLDISRITGGKIRLDLESVDATTVVSAAVETSRPLIEAGRHTLSLSLPEAPVGVRCDPVRLAQVLANLLNNAAKYTPEGGQIWLSLEREGDEAVFRVRDNGVGIPAEMLSKIFDLFTQVERSLDRSQGGLGIGLTLARRMVEMHSGRVEVASEGPGQGSEFTVRIPALADPPPVETNPNKPDERQKASAAAPAVLVVDDNVDAAESLAWLFRLKHHEVHTAHDGRAALEAAQKYRPQVVVLDLGLPELDGYEVARRLRTRAETKDCLLIALSGYGQPEHRRMVADAGFDHHFVKPVDFEALMKTVDASGRRAGTQKSSPCQSTYG